MGKIRMRDRYGVGIEVSYSSLAFDRKEKSAVYAKAGIPEYWILDVENRLVEVHRNPGVISSNPSVFGYTNREIVLSDQAIQPLRVLGPVCEVARFFA